MNENNYPKYCPSGKFAPHGPFLALLATFIIGYPLAFIYVYLIKWVPLIYFNVLIAGGFSVVFGLIAAVLVKFSKIRNHTVALLTGTLAGILGCYLNWNAHLHTLTSQAPFLATPSQIISVMKVLYQNGSWSVGQFFGDHATVKGIPLAIVWAIEAAMIVLISVLATGTSVAGTPYCETHQCWLEQQKKMDKLDAFTNPDHIAALKAGNLAPLEQAQPRIPASGSFARLTLRYSAKCDDYCALSIANVTVTLDKKGNPRENVQPIVTNLWIPKTMFDYLCQFDHPTAKPLIPA